MADARQRATALAREAVDAYHANRLREALDKFVSAIRYFDHALTYDKGLSKKSRELIARKVDEYLEVAEEIKATLAEAEADARAQQAARGPPGGGLALQQARRDPVAGAGSEPAVAASGTRLAEPPATRWADVAGLAHVKRALDDAVVVPERLPHLFGAEHGRQVAAGILLYGPPGTGKTLVARALAGESGRAFFAVSTADIIDKYVGESEQKLRALFEEARAARPSIIFIDEIETLCRARGGDRNASEASQNVVSEFLRQLDGVGTSMDGVLLLGATNLPETLDAAMRRRFTQRIYVPLPDAATRGAILRAKLARVPSAVDAAALADVVARTAGYSAADLAAVVQHALAHTLHMVTDATHFARAPTPDAADDDDDRGWWRPCSPGDPAAVERAYTDVPGGRIVEPPVVAAHLAEALREVRPNVTPEECAKYDTFAAQYGTGHA